MRAPVAAFVVMMLACNGATSPITLGGHALAPYSSLMLGDDTLATVLITDVKDYCKELQASAPANPSCNAALPKPYRPEGNFFTLSFPFPGPRLRYSVDATLDAIFTNHSTQSLVEYVNRASDGGAELVTYESGARVTGHYTLTFPRDGERSGTFEAEACDNRAVLAALQKSRRCIADDRRDAGIDACNRRCTCDLANVGASCSFNASANNWSCLCTLPDFRTTTCVMSTRPDCSTDVGTCCNLEF